MHARSRRIAGEGVDESVRRAVAPMRPGRAVELTADDYADALERVADGGLASGAVYDPNMTTQRCRNQNDASEPIV